jgi:hypothetical protein
MYAFGALEAMTATAVIPTAQLVFDPTPAAYLGLVALAAIVGSLLGIGVRTQRAEPRSKRPVVRAIPRTA